MSLIRSFCCPEQLYITVDNCIANIWEPISGDNHIPYRILRKALLKSFKYNGFVDCTTEGLKMYEDDKDSKIIWEYNPTKSQIKKLGKYKHLIKPFKIKMYVVTHMYIVQNNIL